MSNYEENWASQLSYENAILDWNTCINNARREGIQEKAIEDAKSFYENGASIELIAKSLHMTIEEVEAIVKE